MGASCHQCIELGVGLGHLNRHVVPHSLLTLDLLSSPHSLLTRAMSYDVRRFR
jgi:hypothetical protein